MVYEFKESYEKLTLKLDKLEKECESIVKKHSPQSGNEIFELTRKWESKVDSCVNRNVKPKPDFLTDTFKYSSLSTTSHEVLFRYGNMNTKEELERLYHDVIQSKLRSLRVLKDYLFLLNHVLQNPIKEFPTIEDKIDFVMSNFYLVFNDNMYSIDYLFKLGNVTYRDGEPQEIGKNLQKKGYVTVADDYRENEIVQLTVKGASYVERKKKSTKKKRVLKREKELNEKVDIVLEKLQKLGYGQEIIFEEIEELKSLSGKLKEKTWVQLLKGKVVDLAFAQVINKTTATYILETLADGASKLLEE